MEAENTTIKSVGAILREARLAKGLSIEEVEKATNIRASHIVNLENEAYDKTPGEFFVKGAIRNYGNFLGLNGPELVEQYKASVAGKALHEVEAHDIREAKNVTMKLQLKEKRDVGSGTGKLDVQELVGFSVNWKLIAAGAAGLGLIAGLYFAVPAVTGWVKNMSANSPKVSVAPTTVNNKQDGAENVVTDKVILELKASGRCWLEVSGDGKVIEEVMLREGDVKKYEANDKLVVKYGNIGAVQLKLNGKEVDLKGERGVANKVYTRETAAKNAKPAAEEAKPKEKAEEKTAANADSQAASEQSQTINNTNNTTNNNSNQAAAKVEEPAKPETPAVTAPATKPEPAVEKNTAPEAPKPQVKEKSSKKKKKQ